MKVSVLVATYNREPCLSRFLDRLYNQSLTDWECFILDESPQMYSQKYADSKKVFCEVHEDKNDWGYAAKSKAAKESAEGEWLWFPNDDHEIDPTFLEKMVLFAEDEEADLILCDFIYKGHLRKGEVTTGSVDIGTFLVKRSVFEKYGPFENGACEDAKFVQRAVHDRVKTVILREALVKVK